jgi:hypothetical protein
MSSSANKSLHTNRRHPSPPSVGWGLRGVFYAQALRQRRSVSFFRSVEGPS